MLPVLFSLAQEEGLILGGSTGINVAGAIRLAKELGRGHTVVTILADSGIRYQSNLFNPVFLKERALSRRLGSSDENTQVEEFVIVSLAPRQHWKLKNENIG